MTARRDLLPRPEPFGLRREMAAAFCGVSPTLFDRAVATGELPSPRSICGVKVWSRDKLVDALNGPAGETITEIGDDTCSADEAFD